MYRFSTILFVTLMGCISCTTHSSELKAFSRDEYVPSYKRIPEGRRPNLPIFAPEVTFHQCQNLSEAQMADLITNFTERVSHGPYDLNIAAVVVRASGENCDTSFTIWLEDGRRLDSGFIFFDNPSGLGSNLRADFDDKLVGRRLYDRAMKLLQEAIPDVKVSPYFAPDQGRTRHRTE